MKSLITRAIQNTPAMNTLMIGVLMLGALSFSMLRREVFPEFELDIVLVNVPYPGATPEEVEEGICQKIEEAVRSVDHIKKQTAIAQEGLGSLVLELEPGSDAQRILNEVRSEIDRIPSFPLLAEDPEVKQITLRESAISIGVIGPNATSTEDELRLRDVTEMVRDDLIRLPSVSQATISGAKNYQIDVEISEETLRRYGATLQDVARLIRRENLELPGGTIKTDAQDVVIRGKNKGTIGEEIAAIPLITQPNGVVLTVGEIGTVRDEFADTTSMTLINGRPGMTVSVERTANEDLLAIAERVHEYVASKKLPPGYELVTWGDHAVDVRDRMETLAKNGVQGLVLVLLVLSIFLEVRLAWWVALGIPISILGAAGVLLFTGETLNMLTMFAFLMALGIVVDDAIVIGENIYTHRRPGLSYAEAALTGTMEVLPSVVASVCTTIIAFMPLMFVSGVMGKFIACLPVTMIAMLVISLIESMFILPCHLGHEKGQGWVQWAYSVRRSMHPLARWTIGTLLLLLVLLISHLAYPLVQLIGFSHWLNRVSNRGLDWFAEKLYLPLLQLSIRRTTISVSIALSILLATLGLVAGGFVPFEVMPKLDSKTIEASIIFPDGTPADVTSEAASKIEQAMLALADEYEKLGTPILRLTRRSVGFAKREEGPGSTSEQSGGHLGAVTVELLDTSERTIKSDRIISEWRERSGTYPGAESIKFAAPKMGPGGIPIEFKLLARTEDIESLNKAVEACKQKLAEYPGVYDIDDDSRPGKWEFQLKINEEARAMGVPLADLAETVRAAYYGEEVMRLQRGRHEVKLMVRYPREDRRSFSDFDQIRVRTGSGAERPLTALADVKVERGLSEINRVNQLRSVTISADVDVSRANASNIVQALQEEFVPNVLEKEYPAVKVRWEGQQEQTTESLRSLNVGFLIAIVAMFGLLTLQFKSYFQPLIILAIIPFGAVGAIGGHILFGMPLSLFSIFGLIALTGVVVNDSIVLIDFINHRIQDGYPLDEALLEAGRRRLRPVLLTSITTVAGLLPLLTETSFQAQILIPMAVSLCFGLMLATILVLFLVPTFYAIYGRLLLVFTGSNSQAASHSATDDLRERVGTPV